MWAPGGSAGPASWDRRRVGARLRAALAGLHELQGLRAAQQERVRGALAMQPAGARGPRGRELRLEEALTALQEQLSQLRQQDAGLKTHLDQLDQQISELQLDVCRCSAEAPDSDSRPSSGFYELSDAGSCSLSTSCASVCSDRLSPSLGSLLPVLQPAMARPSMGDWRPRSADETTVPAWRPRPTKDSGRLLDSVEDAGQPHGMFRPRPVSTGDLERVLPADVGLQRGSTDATPTSFLCQGIEVLSPELDPKYQHDLVSRAGREVYLYPSPLHAVALQSPLFSLAKETLQPDSHLPPRSPHLGPRVLNTTPAGPAPEVGQAGAYINRLLHLRSRENSSGGDGGDQGPPGREASPSPQKPSTQSLGNGGWPEKLSCAPGRDDLGGTTQSTATSGDSHGQQGPVPLLHTQSPSHLSEEGPKPWNLWVCGETSVGLSPCPQAQQPLNDCSQGVTSPSGSVDYESPPTASGHFVHPPHTASGASPTRPKMGHPKTKPVEVGRKASAKRLRLGKQALLLPERPQGVRMAPQRPPECDPAHRPQGAGLRRRPMLPGGAPGRSCSESTLYPVPFFVPVLVARPQSFRASSQALFSMEAAPLCAAARRKQRTWQSTVEISAKACLATAHEPSLEPPRPTAGRAAGSQAQSRPMLARQDACGRSESTPSEQSGKYSSLQRSTITETSEEEASDHTANRFGDGESSSSDSEGRTHSHGSSLVVDGAAARCGEQAWPRAVPAGARPLPPVPKLCRIKASRALKKKIRRFQPAALKVMTMV